MFCCTKRHRARILSSIRTPDNIEQFSLLTLCVVSCRNPGSLRWKKANASDLPTLEKWTAEAWEKESQSFSEWNTRQSSSIKRSEKKQILKDISNFCISKHSLAQNTQEYAENNVPVSGRWRKLMSIQQKRERGWSFRNYLGMVILWL